MDDNPPDLKRRRRKHAPNANGVDRLPPHSPEAEAGVLGCILLDPSCMSLCREKLTAEAFYAPQNQTIYSAMTCLPTGRIDVLTLYQRLKDHGQDVDAGGMEYLSSLPEQTPSAANLDYYLGILVEKAQLRKTIQTCTEVLSRAYDQNGDFDDFVWATSADLQTMLDGISGNQTDTAVARISDIEHYPVDNDPNCLMGKRWLCRRGSLLIVGPSGVGKSSLIMQLACSAAVAKSIFGITFTRPLKILVVQAENDDGDLCEMLNGVRQGLDLDIDQEVLLSRNLLFQRDATRTALAFIANLRRLVKEHKPDLVVLDPAVSFMGDDMSKQKACSDFFRVGLNSIAEDTSCAFIIINHTTKPPTDSKSRSAWQSSDWQYAGAGSYDIVGWARAVMTLRQINDTTFNLKISKRGARAGACHPDGTPTTELWLQHATGRIYWEQLDPPGEEPAGDRKHGGKPSKIDAVLGMNTHDFIAGCTSDGEGKVKIAKRLESWLAKRGEDLSTKTCQRIIEQLASNPRNKLRKNDEGLYLKGPNA